MKTTKMKSLAAIINMKSFFLIIFFIAFCSSSYGQSDKKITIGEIDSIESKILKEKRNIWVHVPESYQATQKSYPVIYLLDGDAHFFSVVGMLRQLSTTNGNTITPEMIVVGIPNTDRTRDLTPTHIEADPFMDSNALKTSGGSEKFISFLEKELIPYIDSKYPTEPYKMLIGHSFGGLTVMQVFARHTNLFNSYISIDPSMWWDEQRLLKETQKTLEDKKFEGKTLYLGVANTLYEGLDIATVQKDTSIGSRHIRSILELKSYFEKNNQNGLKYQGKYYVDEDHGSVPLITEYDAFRFIFDYYPLKLTPMDFFDPSIDLADKYEKHFANVSKQMGYQVKPAENTINGMGYQLLSQKQFKRAEKLFKLNVANYPQSSNVYDSYGDYFVAMKDNKNAIIQFKKALSLKDNEETKKKLEKLQSK
jgi:predicted alpha/beta superfamily hydrolase